MNKPVRLTSVKTMKHLSLILVLFSSTVMAQIAAPETKPPQPRRALINPVQKVAAAPLDQNYQITLKMMEKEGAGTPIEVALVVASPEFTASLSEQDLTFSGTLSLAEEGVAIVAYSLAWSKPVTVTPAGVSGEPQGLRPSNIQYQSSSSKGSVRLTMGEEVQILRAGSRIAVLGIQKLTPAKAQ